ncbi:Fe3+-hydroxamate ABC transporter substrate-binding protein [Altererythrobacter sp. B11]|uniref:GxxExxY protein n=1 Tax=Altererythrobacter sp. B11 TaxID=2060312 RepID=UPI000DC6E6F2|nr:GxxExxY protein [Altererythrobacter sp. B11]BBC72444.1 Fe3+-hydroxamate ABC transporter substrate-binding protein [Altererythrobacter sp. B11]
MDQPVDALSGAVVTEAIRIHRELGPGLLESVYELVLAGALARRGIEVERQTPVDIEFDGLRFAAAFRIDLLVGGKLIVEIKSVEALRAVHAKQLLTYLRLTHRSVGLLLNFSGETMKEGIRRVVNNHRPQS